MAAARHRRPAPRRRRRNGQAPLFHVTWFRSLSGIAEHGLKSAARRGITPSPLSSHRVKGVFLTEPDGVLFWFARSEEWASHQADNLLEEGLVPMVLRVARPDTLDLDEIGSKDAFAEAWIAKSVSPSLIDVWDGRAWIPIDEFENIDPTDAFAEDRYEDEDGEEVVGLALKAHSPFLPPPEALEPPL